MITRIKKYFFLRRLGVNHPWKASGDRQFIQGFSTNGFFFGIIRKRRVR